MANLTTTDAQFVVNNGATIPRSGSNARKNGPDEVRILCQNAVITLNYKTDTIEGNSFSTQQEFFDEILSLFTNGGGSGDGAVESVTGDLVDNTDPANPVIDLPTDLLKISDVSSTPQIDKIPIYLGSGTLSVTNASSNSDAINLGQANDLYALKSTMPSYVLWLTYTGVAEDVDQVKLDTGMPGLAPVSSARVAVIPISSDALAFSVMTEPTYNNTTGIITFNLGEVAVNKTYTYCVILKFI